MVYASWKGPLLEQFLSMPLSLIFIFCAFYLISQLISAVKWFILVRLVSTKTTLLECVKAYFMGMYANSFGLGILGGDVVRSLLVKTESRELVAASVVFDRAHGLFILASIGFVSGFFSNGQLTYTQKASWLILVVISLGLAAVFVFWRWLAQFMPRGGENLKQILANFAGFASLVDVKIFIISSVISVCFHLVQLYTLKVFGYFMGKEVDTWSWLVVLPLINILTSLPISWNGVGVRESSAFLLLCPNPFQEPEIILYSALWLFSVLVGSLIGAIFSVLKN